MYVQLSFPDAVAIYLRLMIECNQDLVFGPVSIF